MSMSIENNPNKWLSKTIPTNIDQKKKKKSSSRSIENNLANIGEKESQSTFDEKVSSQVDQK